MVSVGLVAGQGARTANAAEAKSRPVAPTRSGTDASFLRSWFGAQLKEAKYPVNGAAPDSVHSRRVLKHSGDMHVFMKRAKSVLSFIFFVTTAVAVIPAVAGASGVSLLTDTFINTTLANPSLWSLPVGSSGVCLTAGTNTSLTPVPDCQSSGGDANGSGALRLTDNAGNQVGTIFSNVTLPTADGLDVTWDSYQYNGTGADGISFDFAAANPANPAPPTTTGPNGGSLGYVTDGGNSGMPNGYLGFGADVYGNFENTGFGGSGCTQSSPAIPESMGVRGPGNGTTGYCLLGQNNLSSPLTLDSKAVTSRTGLAVPEEVVINSTGSAVTASASGISVPAGDYLFATEPLSSGLAGGTWESIIGALPTDPVGVPAGWLDTNGLPQALAFGWAASTGGSNEFHDLNNLQATSLTVGPILSLTNTDSGSGVLLTNSSDTVTLTPGVSASSTVNETDTVTVTDTFPAGLTPSSASGTGWTCSVAGQNVSCTLPAGNVTPGASFAAITVDVTASATPGSFTNTASVSSTDGAPASDTDSGSIDALPAQVINFTNTPPLPLYVNGTYTVTANGGASGNPVVLAVDGASTSGCTIDASTGVVTISAPAGTCVIDANQSGNAVYGTAAQVQQSLTSLTVTISLVLHYANNSCTLTAWSRKHIYSLALAIKSGRLTLVELSGFASSTGTVTRNNVLGIERARVPANLLRTYLKALHDRHVTLRMMGYGASKFVVKPTSAAANRRTVITVA